MPRLNLLRWAALIYLIVSNPFIISSQIDTSTIGIEGVSIDWIHVPSTNFVKLELQSPDATFISGYADYRNIPFIDNEWLYVCTPIQRTKQSDLEGSLVEKLDIESGELIWQTVIHSGFSGKEEYLDKFYVNDNNDLILLSGRRVKDPGEFTFFGIVSDSCHFSMTRIDTQSGDILFQSQPSDQALSLLNGDGNRSQYHNLRDGNYDYTSFHRNGPQGYNGYYAVRQKLSISGDAIDSPIIHTVQFPEEVDTLWVRHINRNKMFRLNQDTTVIISHATTNFIENGTSLVKLALLDESLETINSFYINESISSYIGHIEILKVDQSFIYTTAVVTDTDSVDDKYEIIYIFDYEGNLLASIDIDGKKTKNFNLKITYDPYRDEFFVLGYNEETCMLNLFSSKNRNGLHLLKSFSYGEDKIKLFPRYIHVLNDSQLLCKFHNGLYREPIWMKIELGEISASADILTPDKEVVLFPNPTSGKVKFATKDLSVVKNMLIYNSVGSLVAKGQIENNSVDFSGFPDGFYYIHFSDSDNKFIGKETVIKISE